MYKIAVIEDDTLLGQALVEMLTSHGYQAFAAESVTKARRLLERQPVDLLLIDRGLADGDGVELCRQRSGQEKLPAIFLTARDEEEDIVEAFDAGADDYLVKPVALAVLLKHIEAVLRRTGGEPNQVFYYQDFSLDYDRKEARIQGKPVALTPKEYGILEVLTRNQKKVVTKRMLLEKVWDDGGNFVEENTLHVTLNRLKKKIEPDPAHPVYVKNVFGTNWLPYVTSYYGYRVHPISGEKNYHTGVDIGMPQGTEILAGHDGVVTQAGEAGSYGLIGVLEGDMEDGRTLTTKYAHCSELLVSAGQEVKQGDVIAKVGSTGDSTGPHLHYEVIVRGKYDNPSKYYYMDLTPEEYDRMIQIAENHGQVMD